MPPVTATTQIRAGRADELNAIFMMGFDTWHGGMSEREYLDTCLASPKYPQGDWLVLARGGVLVSSLIVYRQGLGLPAGCWGIGSVATPPEQRRQGYAAMLVQQVIAEAKRDNIRGLYLFSGIDPGYSRSVALSRSPRPIRVRMRCAWHCAAGIAKSW